MKIELLKKYSILIYVLILIFSVLFYFVLMGASGHGFHFNSTDTIALIFVFCGILLVPNYNSKMIRNTNLKRLSLIVCLVVAIGTLIVGILVLKDGISFQYGADVSRFLIGLFYLIPLVFIIINGLIINNIMAEMRK